MHLIRALLSLVVCLSVFSIDTLVMAQEIFWTLTQSIKIKSQDEETLCIKSINYTVTDHATNIESSDEVVFIDYASMHLYRLDRQTDLCTDFNLGVSEDTTPASITAAQIRTLMAEIAVRDTGEQRHINSQPCQKKFVLLGAGMFRFKTAAPITIESLGQSFCETRGEYWINSTMDAWPTLQKMIPQRQAAFIAVPLLKRIDPLGLMQSLDGFAIQGQAKSKGRIVNSTLTEFPALRASSLAIPEECRRNVPDA